MTPLTAILLVLVIILLLGGLPAVRTHPYGYSAPGVVTVVLIVLLILLLTGRL